MRRVLTAWFPAVSYMAFIWVLSSGTHNISFDAFPFKDKFAHFCEYSLLGFLLAHAVIRSWPDLSRSRALLFAAFITFAWGFFDELHQSFVPGRTADAIDLFADTIGAVAGAIAYPGIVWVRRVLNAR